MVRRGRQGRRASDGLVAQGILNHVDHNSFNSVAFNSQRLHEACKAKGVLELHLLQQEAASLTSQYQSSVPQEELNVRQREHSYYRSDHNSLHFQYGKNEDLSSFNKNVSTITSDISNYVGMMRNDFVKHENGDTNGIKLMAMKGDGQSVQSPQQMQKPPLQQQLMQHRLLQQKRHILQKQGAMETCLSRRHSQMLRQQSYKIAQNQQILPPLPFPLTEKESEDLLAFQQIVENPNALSCTNPHFLTTSHLHSTQISPSISPQPTGVPEPSWNNLSNNLQASCQISEGSATHEIFHQPLYHQVLYHNEREF